jgi:hypothetical protein
MIMNKTVRLDDDGIWLSRELETIEARVFEKKYADIIYPQILPVDTVTVDNASDTYTYRMVDRVGKFRVIQDRASDLPRVDVFRKETTMKVVSIAASYAYTVQETRAARRQGFGLQEQRVMAVRRAYEEKVNEVALFGDSQIGIEGFFNSTSVNKLNVTQTWISSTATADEMLKVLNTAVAFMVKSTNMVERPNTMLMAYEDYNVLSTTPRSATSDTTVLQYFLENDPYITQIVPVNELDDYAGANKNRMVLYNRDPEKLRLHIPQVLEFFPPERSKLEYEVAAHGRVMGTTIYYPKSILYVDQV